VPRLVRVNGLGVVRFPDLMPAHEVSKAINTHLATRPRPAAPAPSQPQRQTLVGPPGNRFGGNSILGQMGDVGHGALSAIGINPFGPEDVGSYETVDTRGALPGNRARFQTEERKLGQVPDLPRKPGKPFYSALEKAIESKMPAQSSIQQVMGIIENPKNAVKADELAWTGVKDWLMDRAKQGPKVSKDDLLDYVRSHNVQLQEVTKGEPRKTALAWTDPYPGPEGYTWATNAGRDQAFAIRESKIRCHWLD
jgi:hypothetical protein